MCDVGLIFKNFNVAIQSTSTAAEDENDFSLVSQIKACNFHSSS